ncbi:MAG: hypothetical protein OXH00_21540 [Candidatus Poribacteria bacterium]|nr:hypothetical protein [Candidatus Poribacteria bacterium]
MAINAHNKASYGIQEQSDSGDFLVFFQTRWRPHRQALIVLSETSDNNPIIVYGVLPECDFGSGEGVFMQTLGYDIRWQDIVEIDWGIFTRFVNTTCDISVHNATLNPTGDEGNNIAFSGDKNWLSPALRAGMIRTGRPSTMEESFAFANHPTWQKRAREFNKKR